jgi:hypothetical protein
MAEKPNTTSDEKRGDPRVEGIATVGWITLAALGVCIPLTAVIGEFAGAMAVLFPLAVLLGSGIMAMRIWSSGERRVNEENREALTERVRDLEERLANLEMIDSLEAHFAGKNRLPIPEPSPQEETPALGPSREDAAH